MSSSFSRRVARGCSAPGSIVSSVAVFTIVAVLGFPAPNARSVAQAATETGMCPASIAPLADWGKGPSWTGWGNGPLQQRFSPASYAALTADQVPKLRLKWAFGFPDTQRAFGQPTVASGRVVVGSQNAKVYSLDAESGCIHWAFAADAPVRTSISLGTDSSSTGWLAYFGDMAANVYAVDAASGKLVWKTHVDDHKNAVVTGAPTLAGGKLYVPVSSYEELTGASPTYGCCTFRGSVVALDALNGSMVWKAYTTADPPKPTTKNGQGTQRFGPSGAAVWSAPTVDLAEHAVYVATGDNYSLPTTATSDAVLAFDSDNGKLLWSHQATAGDVYTLDCALPVSMRTNCPPARGLDYDFGSSPVVVNLPGGGQVLLAGQKSGMMYGLDPERKGALIWQQRVGEGGPLGGVQWGFAVDADTAYVAVSDVAIDPVPPGTAGARQSGYGFLLLDPKKGGGLVALDVRTGTVRWRTPNPGCGELLGCSPAQSAAVTAMPGVVFSADLGGRVRAYAENDGHVMWQVDTKRAYETVNGVAAAGGSIDGPGPVVVGGTVFVESGASLFGTAPGNVLLAFTVDGK